MKKAAWILLIVAAFILLAMQSCKPKPKGMIIHSFERHKDSFVTVAEYIENLEWEDHWIGFRISSENKIQFSHSDGSVNTEMLGIDDDVVQSAEGILFKLGYQKLQRTHASENTIIFEVKDPFSIGLTTTKGCAT